jgi:hypothetical protein
LTYLPTGRSRNTPVLELVVCSRTEADEKIALGHEMYEISTAEI